MAELKLNPVFGRISGKLGNFIFRNMNGKTFVSGRRRNASPYCSQRTIKRRLRFGINSKFASSVLKLPYTSVLWSEKAFKCSGFNVLSRENYRFITDNEILEGVKIFPQECDYIFSEEMINVDENSISLSVPPEVVCMDNDRKPKYFQLIMIIHCFDKIKYNIPDYDFIHFCSDSVKISLKKGLKLNLNLIQVTASTSLTTSDSNVFSSYDRHSYIMAYVLLDKNKNYIAHSETLLKKT